MCPHLLLADQRVHVEGQEQAVEQVVRQHVIEKLTVDDEDVVQIVEMVQMLGYQIAEFSSVFMSDEKGYRWENVQYILIIYVHEQAMF